MILEHPVNSTSAGVLYEHDLAYEPEMFWYWHQSQQLRDKESTVMMSFQIGMHNRYRLYLFAALVAAVQCMHPTMLRAQETVTLKVVAERESAICEVGETARFVVSVSDANGMVTEGKASYVVDDFISNQHDELMFPKGNLDLSSDRTVVDETDL